MALKEFLASFGSTSPLPGIAGKYVGKGLGVIVCGDAINVWDDLERFGCRSNVGRGKVEKDGWHFLTVNKLCETFPGNIEHCYSNEPSLLAKFLSSRRSEYTREFSSPANSHSITQGAHWVWPWGGHGTSGLGACLTAVGLGYDKIVICGMPLDNGPHNGEPPWRRCAFESSEAAGSVETGVNTYWKRAKETAFEGKVKSMSGRTRDWLGSP